MATQEQRDKLLMNVFEIVPRPEIEPWMTLGDRQGEVIDVASDEGLKFLNLARVDNKWDYLKHPVEEVAHIESSALVVVFGASGAGKDVVTDVIQEELGSSSVWISSDWYYGPSGKILGSDKPAVYLDNYDHPNSVDWDLLYRNLFWLQSGFSVFAPEYDFATHSRVIDGANRIEPKPIIVVSGIMTAHVLREQADLLICVDAPWDVCKKRRVDRDVEERGRVEEDCLEQIKDTVEPGFKEFVEPYVEMVRSGDLEGGVLVDNSAQAKVGFEPARVNSKVYIEPLRQLLSGVRT